MLGAVSDWPPALPTTVPTRAMPIHQYLGYDG